MDIYSPASTPCFCICKPGGSSAQIEYPGSTVRSSTAGAKREALRHPDSMSTDVRESSKGEEAKSCCERACEAPKTSVLDDIGLDDEEASIVIVGGGPHALAALAALHEDSFAFQQYGEGMFQSRVGFKSLERVGSGPRARP